MNSKYDVPFSGRSRATVKHIRLFSPCCFRLVLQAWPQRLSTYHPSSMKCLDGLVGKTGSFISAKRQMNRCSFSHRITRGVDHASTAPRQPPFVIGQANNPSKSTALSHANYSSTYPGQVLNILNLFVLHHSWQISLVCSNHPSPPRQLPLPPYWSHHRSGRHFFCPATRHRLVRA